MTAILNDEGRLDNLRGILAFSAAQLRVKLITAPSVNTRSKVLADYTEATYSGYAQQTPAFAAPIASPNNNAESDAAALTFTHSGGGVANTIVGYILVQVGTGFVWFSELFSAPVVMSVAGNTITLTPKLYLGDILPPL